MDTLNSTGADGEYDIERWQQESLTLRATLKRREAAAQHDVDTKVPELRSQIEERNLHVAALQRQLDTIQAQIDTIQTQNATAVHEITELELKCKRMRENSQQLHNAIRSLGTMQTEPLAGSIPIASPQTTEPTPRENNSSSHPNVQQPPPAPAPAPTATHDPSPSPESNRAVRRTRKAQKRLTEEARPGREEQKRRRTSKHSGQAEEPENGKQLAPRRTIPYDDVYLDGKTTHKIIEYPKASGCFFILQCLRHSKNFGFPALLSATHHARGLSHKLHTGPAGIVDEFGVFVLHCNAERAAKNNDAYKQSLDQSRGVEEHQGSRGTTAAAEKGVCNPVAGKIYIGRWGSDAHPSKSWYAVLVLPLDDFETIGMIGWLEDTGLLEGRIPACYRTQDGAILGWEQQYEDGGRNVSRRRFPVMWLQPGLELKIEEGNLMMPRTDCFSWIAATNLRPFKQVSPNGSPVIGLEIARQFEAHVKSAGLFEDDGENQTPNRTPEMSTLPITPSRSPEASTATSAVRNARHDAPANLQSPVSNAEQSNDFGANETRNISAIRDKNTPVEERNRSASNTLPENTGNSRPVAASSLSPNSIATLASNAFSVLRDSRGQLSRDTWEIPRQKHIPPYRTPSSVANVLCEQSSSNWPGVI